MRATKCDICGVFHEYYGNRADRPNTITLQTRTFLRDEIAANWRFDACPECLKAVAELLKARGAKVGAKW